eukprot:CAMPEP_0184367866 /NCGR_PEP_ID=MMETSP1089-20130417/160215_1 /TAXON_ID=38269 ORGANISM="Gloeochaete wittrockiana, Strain SAG46.84" /NCGR_SAMPLE_ID=MMETSP1089 /ASSEMBLY_ACC=CAM_ASM_000445 /LENGTH=55 /DNA_ID=CAMNT_0026709985 /DNA_START=1 /DNA_END=164 /DNA_ORIENTATION=+
METGASIVPAYAFGQNEIYLQVKHPYIVSIQRYIVRKFRMCIPIFYGALGTLFPL